MGTDKLNVGNLVEAYNAGESASSLARRHKCSVWAIITRLRKAGVEIRKNQNQRVLALDDDQRQKLQAITDGLLLGDGSIGKQCGELRLEQCPANKGWIDQVAQELAVLGCESRIIPIKPKKKWFEKESRMIVGSGGDLLYTPSYTFFQEQRSRWYPEGEKIVPRDLQLTPECVAHWFCGDGSYDASGCVFFYTNSFSRDDVSFLAKSLTSLGVSARCARHTRPGADWEYKVSITDKKEACKLKDMLEPLMPECFLYKLQHIRPPKRGGNPKLNRKKAEEIRASSATQGELATKYGVSQTTISRVINRKVYNDE